MIYINDLVQILPDFIFYIVVGFFFIQVFHFTALKRNNSDIEHILTGSLVFGYVICKIMELIPFSINPIIDSFGIMCTSIVAGYILGLPFQYNQIIYKICDIFKLRNSINDYIWDDILDWDYPNKLIVYYSDKIIEGYVHYSESYSNIPSVTLAGYIIRDKNQNILSDHSSDNDKVIFLQLCNAEYVEVIYNHKSPMCMEIKDLANNNKKNTSN